MAVAENSVLSTDEVDILFVQEPYLKHIEETIFAYYFLTSKYIVQIYNKTDKTIYLDMGNTSRVLADGTSKIYFDISQTTISKGNISGVSLGLGKNLGGGVLGNVGIGGGSTANTSKTYAKQRVLAVPPHGKIPLEVYQQVHVKGKHYEVITEGESSLHAFPKGGQPKVSCGGKITYDVDSSPFRAQYTINYATNEDLSDAKNISATLYMRDLYGLKSSTWDNGKGSAQKVIDEIKETVPDYDDHTILGSWYTNWR